jgi:predicted anti-sigma-YlaC factor YlaD
MDIVVGSCEDTRELLSDYLEGELKGFRRVRVRMHLAGCDLCTAALRSLRRTVDGLRELGDVAPATPSVASAVTDRIREPS